MRKLREKYDGAVYHVVAKINRGEFILGAFEIKEMFLDTLLRAKKKYPYKLKHFCIMGNHVHLLIKTIDHTDLSRLMQWILSVFARKFNKKFGYSGHVWYDRFKSKVVKSYHQLIQTFQYISDNPIKAKMCNDAFEYAFSGLYFLKQKKLDILDPPISIIKIIYPTKQFNSQK